MPSRRRAVWFLTAVLVAVACTGDSPRTERGGVTTTAAAAPPVTAATLPPSPPGPVSGFVAFGDFGGGPAQGAVAAAMERWVADGHRVDALVTTGDNVYDFGEPRLFRPYLDEPYRNLRRGGRPLWVTLGNHDVAHGHGAKQLAHLGLPELPYAKELAGVRLFFLDANYPDDDQAEWLDERLATPGPPFSVVVFHQPLYSCGLHGPTPAVVANWKPVIESRQTSLVLTGHDHDYFRFQTVTGVTYIVTGGGGRDLYPATPDCAPELRASAVRHHFTAVEVYPYRMVVSAIGTDGSVFDQVEIPAAVTP